MANPRHGAEPTRHDGPKLGRRRALCFGLATAAASFACRSGLAAGRTLRIAVTPGPMAETVEFAAARARAGGLEVELVEFSDWIMPNEAVSSGEADANVFQHIPFMNAAIKARGYDLVPVAPLLIMPVGLFSKKIKRFDEVPDGATVSIANDPINGARGLQLYQKAGLLKLTPGLGDDVTVADIEENPKNLRIVELEAPQLYRALDDVAVGQVSVAFLFAAGGNWRDALLTDGAGDPHYAINLITRSALKDDPRLQQFLTVFRSPEEKALVADRFQGAITTTW